SSGRDRARLLACPRGGNWLATATMGVASVHSHRCAGPDHRSAKPKRHCDLPAGGDFGIRNLPARPHPEQPSDTILWRDFLCALSLPWLLSRDFVATDDRGDGLPQFDLRVRGSADAGNCRGLHSPFRNRVAVPENQTSFRKTENGEENAR